MSFRLTINSPAENDFTEALKYYLDKSPHTARKFVESTEEAYRKLQQSPQFYSYFYNSERARSISLKPFPYQVIFIIRDDEVIVVALHNTYRDPEIALLRLD